MILINVEEELDKYDLVEMGIPVMAFNNGIMPPKEETDNVVVADNTENAVVQSDAIADTQFDSEGTGYDLDIAKQLNFEPSKIEDANFGHMQSAAPISELINSGVFTEEDLLKFGIPENSSMLLKGMQHESVNKELNAPHNLEYKKINTPLGERYIGFPKTNTQNITEQSDTINDTQEQSVVANVAEDTPKAIIQGVVEGSRNFNDFMGDLVGAPGDAFNYIGKNLTGQEDFNKFLGSEDIKQKVQSSLSWLDENIMPDIGFNEYANEPFNYELYGEIVKVVAQFATPAVPTAKVLSGAKLIQKGWRKADLWVEGMKAPNPFVRGMVWGSIADAAAFPEMQNTLTDDLAKYLLGQTPEERSEFGNVVVSIFEKNVDDPAIVNRLRTSLEGLILGGAIQGFIEVAVKGAKLIPWDQLFKEAEINTNSLNLQTSNTKL